MIAEFCQWKKKELLLSNQRLGKRQLTFAGTKIYFVLCQLWNFEREKYWTDTFFTNHGLRTGGFYLHSLQSAQLLLVISFSQWMANLMCLCILQLRVVPTCCLNVELLFYNSMHCIHYFSFLLTCHSLLAEYFEKVWISM